LKKNIFIRYEKPEDTPIQPRIVGQKDFKILKLIGMGSFGRVYLVKSNFDEKT